MLVAGSEVPNVLEHGAASTLVVSQDVDIGVPVQKHADVKTRLSRLEGLAPSPEEPYPTRERARVAKLLVRLADEHR